MSLAALLLLQEDRAEAGAALARRLGIDCIEAAPLTGARGRRYREFVASHLGPPPCQLLEWGPDGLALVRIEPRQILTVRADFTAPAVDFRRRQGGRRSEGIARAVGLRAGQLPPVLDATAGLGGDAFVLAALGCEVTLLERVPALQELLADALLRAHSEAAARQDSELKAALDRMHLVRSEATAYLAPLPDASRPEVIYLDPMFPERRKSAAVKKDMQLLHHLVGSDADADQLLPIALHVARRRVVVKRPRQAEPLGGRRPEHVIEGVRNRYDLYQPVGLPNPK